VGVHLLQRTNLVSEVGEFVLIFLMCKYLFLLR